LGGTRKSTMSDTCGTEADGRLCRPYRAGGWGAPPPRVPSRPPYGGRSVALGCSMSPLRGSGAPRGLAWIPHPRLVRNPGSSKETRNPNSQCPKRRQQRVALGLVYRFGGSGFGIRDSFGFRDSRFGFPAFREKCGLAHTAPAGLRCPVRGPLSF
jgi:hypothetical protein